MKIAFLSSHFQLLFGFTCINKFLQDLGAHLRYNNVLCNAFTGSNCTYSTESSFVQLHYVSLHSHVILHWQRELWAALHADPSPRHAYVEKRADGTVIFLPRVLCCCLVLSHIIYFLHKVSLTQLFLIPVVEFQRAQLAPPICHLGGDWDPGCGLAIGCWPP